MATHREVLTEGVLKELKPGEKPRWVWDAEYRRLAVLVHPSGRRTFYLVRKFEGRTEKLALGTWPDMKVRAARAEAEHYGGQYRPDLSPLVERRKRRAKAEAAVSLAKAWEEYKRVRLIRADARRERVVRFEEYNWTRHLKPRLGALPVNKLDPKEVVLPWFEAVTEAAGKVAANRSRTLLGAIVKTWAARVREPIQNPIAGSVVKRHREDGREVYFQPGQLRAWWGGVLSWERDGAEMLAALMLTAARQGNLRAMRWEEVDWQGLTWTVPRERTKAGTRAIVLPLNRAAAGTLVARWVRMGRPAAGLVFPRADGGMRTEVRDVWDRVLRTAGLAGFTPHDCRRTFATHAAEAGLDTAIIAYLLGHIDKTVIGRYRKITTAAAAAGSEEAARALLRPAGLMVEDFFRGLPSVDMMRPMEESGQLVLFPGIAGGD